MHLSSDQKRIIKSIKFILDVDFVPDSIEEYKSLPEPWRSEALSKLKQRNNEFSELANEKKALL